jgi:hypothetical protein
VRCHIVQTSSRLDAARALSRIAQCDAWRQHSGLQYDLSEIIRAVHYSSVPAARRSMTARNPLSSDQLNRLCRRDPLMQPRAGWRHPSRVGKGASAAVRSGPSPRAQGAPVVTSPRCWCGDRPRAGTIQTGRPFEQGSMSSTITRILCCIFGGSATIRPLRCWIYADHQPRPHTDPHRTTARPGRTVTETLANSPRAHRFPPKSGTLIN